MRLTVLCGWVIAGAAAWAADGAGGLREDALAPRSGPRGATMFTVMTPEQTGIVTDNRYDDPKMWGEHYQELAYGAMGTGVASGDYDNDGRPDLLVVSKTGGCRLFRNLGGWKFADVTDQAGLGEASAGVLASGLDWLKRSVGQSGTSSEDAGKWRQGAVFADVNNDGWLDIYVCRFDAPNLLYINQRDGTFKEAAPPRRMRVRWPDGTITTRELASPPANLILSVADPKP